MRKSTKIELTNVHVLLTLGLKEKSSRMTNKSVNSSVSQSLILVKKFEIPRNWVHMKNNFRSNANEKYPYKCMFLSVGFIQFLCLKSMDTTKISVLIYLFCFRGKMMFIRSNRMFLGLNGCFMHRYMVHSKY